MPEPIEMAAQPVAQEVTFQETPGGDLPFSSLFPETDEGLSTTVDQNTPVQAPQAPATPEVKPAEDFFLQGSNSVYKSREAAIEGINQKDALIAQLREQLGHGQTTAPAVAPQPQAQEPTNYAQNPDRYYDDLTTAVQQGDKRAWTSIQTKFIQDTLAPYAPLLQDAGKTKAMTTVSGEIKDFTQFMQSDQYAKTLDKMPVLREAVQVAESRPELYNSLPQLYQLTYYASKGLQLPQILEAAATSKAPNQTAQPTRPPMTPATQTPAVTGGRTDLTTPEGRKAYIQQMESGGILDVKF